MRLSEKYKKEVIPAMMKKFGYENKLAVPQIKQAVLNVGIGRFLDKKEVVEKIAQDLAIIAGQKPVFTQAKKAISGFKIRAGQKVGLRVTLRGQRMWDFLERLVFLALPRTRDFHGLAPKTVDQQGNLTIGIKEHIVFPEASSENIKQIFGLEVCISTNAKNQEQGLALFRCLGFPIKSE